MIEPSGWIRDLARRLHPLEQPLSGLPVRGYRSPEPASWHPRPAAVLVPIIDSDDPEVLLTVRSRQLPHHAGQVSLPGGGCREPETFPVETALRETCEEIGIDTAMIEPLGLLDRYDTISGYRVVPVVARLSPEARLHPCPEEVESIFSLPWQVVIRQESYRRHRVVRGHHHYELVSMATRSPRLVWGATAAILMQLAD
ncbi:CoA pyrophosphatase [Wenzhouxiangella sp. AB-CW3]|uniref:NUDIX hydrolase n=1 Tax=Wenzhouxiangella sp. AB-CW3 TaxID=2771012 RepID=UPI00168B24B2|nr:CoA pyrophosphatase [Wenzhouxiangella sp. AB-CW3]QOC23610.1 CoA pyrophosphatase [Wenzhouxiangella sp. AB-CW3]